MVQDHQSKQLRKIAMLENAERKADFPASKLLELLPANGSANILDLGTGTGYLAIPAAKETSGIVYALDMDENMLDYVNDKAQKLAIENIKTVLGNFESIPLKKATIDTAIASLALHEIAPVSAALNEINRVIVDGGHLLCVEFEGSDNAKGPRINSSDMEQALIEAGFDIKEKRFPSAKIVNESVYIIVAQKRKA